ncbi:MAG: hypothetical protein WDZ54_13175 [Sneathiella sp.]
MEKNNPYVELYDRIFFYLWDITTGQGGSKRQKYNGARLYGQFLLSEIARYEEVKSAGGLSIERHGLVAPKAVMKAWAFNILEDCFTSRITPPFELCGAIYYLMGCKHLSRKRGKYEAKEAYYEQFHGKDSIGIREASRKLEVNPATILRWKNETPEGKSPKFPGGDEEYSGEYERIRELTNVEEFYPMKYRVLRKKSLAQHEQDVP